MIDIKERPALDVVELTDDDIEWVLLTVDGEEVSRTTGDAYLGITFTFTHRFRPAKVVNRVRRVDIDVTYPFDPVIVYWQDTLGFTLYPTASMVLG